VEDYKNDFEFLLKKALHFADDKNDRVIVLSIPDWSVTPFAKDHDAKKISEEIIAFNNANADISKKYKVHYVDITNGSREAANDASFIASDGLHPSGKEYARWAEQIASVMEKALTE
jgi:lysophospholipase L1-like esterase